MRPDRVVEQDGLWYHLWEKKQPPGHVVEQLLLPKPYHQVLCKLIHSIPPWKRQDDQQNHTAILLADCVP